jgi:hypothetical protein
MPVELITEHSPLWLIACLLLGLLFAFVLYRYPAIESLGKVLHRLMFAFRTVVIAILAFFLLSPLLRTLSREKEKPLVLVAADNSQSLLLNRDSAYYRSDYSRDLHRFADRLGDRFEVRWLRFGEEVRETDTLDLKDRQTDLSQLLSESSVRYANRNVGAIVLASDGIINKGMNPQYVSTGLQAPVYTVLLGDTVVRKDLMIVRVDHNKTAYLGNAFPLSVVVEGRQLLSGQVTVSVLEDSTVRFSRSFTVTGNRFRQEVPVLLEADKKGLHHYKVRLNQLEGEVTYTNNERNLYIEVLEQKQQVLILASAPHPDLGAFREVLERTRNYEVKVRRFDRFDGNLNGLNLLVLHNLPDHAHDPAAVVKKATDAGLPILFVLGSNTNVNALNALQAGLSIQGGSSGRMNAAAPVVENNFSLFILSDALRGALPAFPPLLSPFGKYKPAGTPYVMLYQQIGSVRSAEPLLFFTESGRSRRAFLCGEGFWRWPIADYGQNGSWDASQELLLKTVQYLSVTGNRSNFRILARNSYAENEAVVLDAEVYDQSYTLVNSPDVSLNLLRPDGKKFPYTFSKTGNAYSLNAGFLAPGDYRYDAEVTVGDKRYTATGRFSVTPVEAEREETVADHALLYNLAARNGGKAFGRDQLDALADTLLQREDMRTVSYARVRLEDLIQVKWIFFLLLALLSAEWFIRKRSGLY